MTAKHKKISLSRPDVSEADVEAVAAVLRSGRLSLGPVGPQFETAFAKAVGAKHAVAVSSGTAAEAPEYISAETEVPDLSSVATIIQREP